MIMKKNKINYHLGFKKRVVYAVIATVVLSFLFNIINITAYVSKTDKIELNTAVLQIGYDIVQISDDFNLPIVNDLFNDSKGKVPDKATNAENLVSSHSNDTGILPLTVSEKWFKESLQIRTLAPPGIKYMQVYAFPFINHLVQSLDFMLSSNIYFYLLLFCIIMLSLPRGVPTIIKKIINIKFACPDFIKVGFFIF